MEIILKAMPLIQPKLNLEPWGLLDTIFINCYLLQ